MAKLEKPTAVVATPVGAKLQSKKNLALAFNRVLKKNRFIPLQILIKDVFPNLAPEKQADVLMKLLQYQYPTVSSQNAKKPQRIQVNTQVNNGPPVVPDTKPTDMQISSAPQISLQDLLAIASGSVEKK